MKKSFVILSLVISIPILIVSVVLAILFSQLKATCIDRPSIENAKYCLGLVTKYGPSLKNFASFTRNESLTKNTNRLMLLGNLLEHEQLLLGLNTQKPTTIMVLLQNDYELRANGGFIGSYAIVTMSNGIPEFQFKDIYDPDGQLTGHVNPPLPIQEAFKQGWWKLRDADWYPDFPTSAKTIRWFMTEGKEINPDILITLNFKTVDQIVKLISPIEIPEYGVKLSPANFYQILQSHAETNFFPGSTQKRDILSATGKAFIKKLQDSPLDTKIKIAQLLFENAESKNILLNSTDQDLQSLFESYNLDGSLYFKDCGQNCLSDHLSIIETNLGANKANCCIQRNTSHKIDRLSDQIKHTITIQYTNTSHVENPNPPDFFGGSYINFIRFYIPPNAAFVEITAIPTIPQNIALYPVPYGTKQSATLIQTQSLGFKEIGFFHTTRANTTSSLTLTYFLPVQEKEKYQLTISKQHGLTEVPTSISLFTKTYHTDMESDFQEISSIPKN